MNCRNSVCSILSLLMLNAMFSKSNERNLKVSSETIKQSNNQHCLILKQKLSMQQPLLQQHNYVLIL